MKSVWITEILDPEELDVMDLRTIISVHSNERAALEAAEGHPRARVNEYPVDPDERPIPAPQRITR